MTRVAFSPAAAPANPESAINGPVEPSASLQITGRVAQENAYVKLGAFHTLDVEANRDVRIEKTEWDSIALDRVEESSIPGRGAEVGAVVCGEGTLNSIYPSAGINDASTQAPLLSVYSLNI